MAILKDLIVHGSSRFLNKIYASEIQTPLIEAESGIIKKLKADDVTVVGLLDVQGQMHTSSWTNSNIATIDGSFYITPTIECASGTLSSLTINTSTPPKHSFVLTAATGSSFAVVNSLYYYDTSAHTVTWAKYSKVLITGEILVGGEWIPLGTILGQLNADGASGSISIFNGQNNKHGTSTVLTELTSTNITSAEFRNLKISLYQRSGSTTTNTDAYKYPLGIYLTALGQNGKTFLDIYGGVNALTTSYGGYANPNVRIGNLSGLPAITTAAGNFTPVGWGIYTTNGYFSGTIVSNTGVIGGWKLGASSLYNGTTGLNNNTVGIYLGTDGIRNYSTSTQYVNITGGKIKAQGVDLTGAITASSGSIGGWNIGTDTNKSLYYGNQTPGATTTNLILSPTSATNSNAIGGSGTGLTWFISAGKVFGVTTAGALYATSGKIGGWTIGTSSLYNSKSSYNNSNEGLYLGTDYIAGGAGEEWWFKKDGSAKIGAMTLSAAGVLSVPAANISGQLTAATIDASKISTGDISSDRITTNVLTALQAKLTSLNTNNLSAITANLGTITTGVIKHDTVGGINGIWFSADTDTSSNVTIGNSTARKDWRLLVNNKFGVTKEGDLYASSVDLTGKITATSGSIGGIDIIDGNLNVSSINIGSLNGVSNYAQKTYVDDAIDDLQIGGRNLLKGSNVVLNDITDYIVGGVVTQTLPTGTVITLSVQIDADDVSWKSSGSKLRMGIASSVVKDSGGKQYLEVWAAQTGCSGTGIVKTFDTSFHGRIKCTYTLQGTLEIGKNFSLYIQDVASGTVSISNPKLEIGNKATDWTPAPEDTQESINSVSTVANTALSQSSWYAECSTPGATTEKVATITPVTTVFTLTEGATVNVKFDVKNAGAVGSITLNVNGTGAKNIKYINNNAISNIPGTDYIAAGCTYQFVYDGTYWVIQNLNYNTNTNTIGTLGATKLIAGTNVSNAPATTVYRYTLIMKKTIGDSPTWVSLVTSSSTGTSKTRYTGGFYPDEIFYMSTNVSKSPYGYSTGASTGDSYAAFGFDLRYSTNCGSTLVIGKPVYLVGAINSLDGLFYLDSTWWTQTEPTIEDGKTYIYLGKAYSATNVYLVEKNPLMRFYQGAFRTEEQIAGMTATSYITYIDANNGIQVHNSDDLTDYIQINSDAISIYRGDPQQLGLSMETLRIEDDNIRIGKVGQQNLLLKENGVFIRNNDKDSLVINANELSYMLQNGQKLFSVKKSVFSQTQTGNGSTKTFTSSSNCYVTDLQQLKINDVVITQGYSVSINNGTCTVVFQTAPANNASIIFSFVVDYYITEEVFISDGTEYEINKTSIGVLKVYIDDVETSNYTVSQNYQVTLGSDPGEDHTIRVSYRAELTGFYTNLGLMDEEEKPQGLYSVVTGIGCSAVGANSFAGGQNTYVSGENSFGYGYGASDSDRLEVRGKHSGAIGTNSVVYGNNCGAIGTGLKVSGDNSFAIGSYGSHGSAVAFSIGNGTSNSNRTNAFWVGKTGNVGIAGRLFSSTSALGSDRRALFVRDTSEGSVTVGAGTTNNFSINISKTNYTPWAIYGLYSSSASCNVYRWYMDGNNFVGRVYNPGTSNITVNLTVYVSYIATSAL